MDATPEAQTARREHIGGVIGIGIGLLVLAGSLMGLASAGYLQLGRTQVDGPAQVAELFVDDGPPFGLELAEAALMPGGEILVRLERAGANAASEDSDDSATEDPPGLADDEVIESSDVTEPEVPVEPLEVVLVRYKNAAAAADLFTRVQGNPWRRRREDADQARGASATLLRWQKDPSFAWHTTIERDQITWSRWSADLQIERSFQEGGVWRDSARVNLSQSQRPLVLFARWPDGTTVDRDVLGRLLRTIRMLESTEES